VCFISLSAVQGVHLDKDAIPYRFGLEVVDVVSYYVKVVSFWSWFLISCEADGFCRAKVLYFNKKEVGSSGLI